MWDNVRSPICSAGLESSPPAVGLSEVAEGDGRGEPAPPGVAVEVSEPPESLQAITMSAAITARMEKTGLRICANSVAAPAPRCSGLSHRAAARLPRALSA